MTEGLHDALASVTATKSPTLSVRLLEKKTESRQCYRPLAYFFDSFYTYASLRFTINVLKLLIILSSASVQRNTDANKKERILNAWETGDISSYRNTMLHRA